MPTKNDISAYKLRNLQALPKMGVTEKHSAWRKAKPVAEKQSMSITLRFTPAEYEHIKKKAGLVQSATYLRHAIFTQTDLFK